MKDPDTPPSTPKSNAENRRFGFLSDVLKLLSGTVAAQLITLITAPIISRLYLPEAFGTLTVFVSLVSIVGVIVCLRYESAILLAEDDQEAYHLLILSLCITLLISLATGIVLYLAYEPILNLLNAPSLRPVLWFVPLGLVFQGVINSLINWNLRRKLYGNQAVARMSASMATSTMPMALSLTLIDKAEGLIISWFSGLLTTLTILSWHWWPQQARERTDYFRWRQLIVYAKRYRKFPLVDIWSAFFSNLSWQLPTLILSVYFSETVVGYYSQANRVVLLPLTLIGSSIAQVFFQRMAELRAEPEKIAQATKTVFRQLVVLGLLPTLILTILGKELFAFVFGANWAEAGIYVQIMGLWAFFLFVSSPLSFLLTVLERQELSLAIHGVILLFRTLALLIGGYWRDIYLMLAIWTISGVVIYGVLIWGILRLAGVQARFMGKTLAQQGFYVLPLVIVMLFLKQKAMNSPFLVWGVIGGLSCLYYGLVLSRDADLRQRLWLFSR